MVIYTPNALTRVPGGRVTPASMEGLIADEMLVASTAFTKSKINNIGLRLVHTEQVTFRPKMEHACTEVVGACFWNQEASTHRFRCTVLII